MFERETMNAEKKTFISIFFKDSKGTMYSMELKAKKIGNELFYAYKEEIEKMQQKKSEISMKTSNRSSQITQASFL